MEASIQATLDEICVMMTALQRRVEAIETNLQVSIGQQKAANVSDDNNK